jgi:hypothetical protein
LDESSAVTRGNAATTEHAGHWSVSSQSAHHAVQPSQRAARSRCFSPTEISEPDQQPATYWRAITLANPANVDHPPGKVAQKERQPKWG